jgi:hypothetical protein
MSAWMLSCPVPAFLVQVTAPTPHTKGRLLAVSPDMAELLTVLTLRESSLGFVRLCPDGSMAKAHQFEYSWDLDILGEVIMRRGMFTLVVPTAGDQRVVDICLTPIISRPAFTNPSEMSSEGAENGRCRITGYIGFWMARLYDQALGSLFVASYDSQGYMDRIVLVC